MLLQIGTLVQQVQESGYRAGRGISSDMLTRINSLSRGESFEVDVVDAQGNTITAGAVVTLAGIDGSYGAYIQLKGSSTSYYCTGTTADGKYVAPHKIDGNGVVSSEITQIPKIRIDSQSLANKLLGLENGARRGYNGSYSMQHYADGSISVFFNGGSHQEGLNVQSQTYVSGIWRGDSQFSQLRTPSSEEMDAIIERNRERLVELEARKEELTQRHDRLVSNREPAQMRIQSQEGDPNNPSELKTTVMFEELDDNGQPIDGRVHTIEVIGERLYFNALCVAFKDDLIETGEVSGHPTHFRSIYGSSQAVASGYRINEMEKEPEQVLSPKEEQFLRKYSNTPEGETPSWQGFWEFARDTSQSNPLLQKYREDREAFWSEFFEVGNDKAFWELANDVTGLRDNLDLRYVQGEGPVIRVSDAAPGWKYTLRRRNLGSLEISFPDKSAETPRIQQ